MLLILSGYMRMMMVMVPMVMWRAVKISHRLSRSHGEDAPH
jgi:hypothetical protein